MQALSCLPDMKRWKPTTIMMNGMRGIGMTSRSLLTTPALSVRHGGTPQSILPAQLGRFQQDYTKRLLDKALRALWTESSFWKLLRA